MKDKSLDSFIIIIIVLIIIAFRYPIIFIVILLLAGVFFSIHKFHNRDWLLKHKQKIIDKAKDKKKMSNIIDRLYKINFQYLSHVGYSQIVWISKVLKKNEQILFAQCGLEYANANSGAQEIILLLTNQRLIVIDNMPVLDINLNQITNLKFHKRIPLMQHKNKLTIFYHSKYYNNNFKGIVGAIRHVPANAEKNNKEILYLISQKGFEKIQSIINQYNN